MSQQKIQDLIRQVNSSRVKYVYSALLDIKQNLISSSRVVRRLVSAGLVDKLLQLIKARDSLEERFRLKVTELTISILGNMCMEDVTRRQVIKLGGIEPLADLFETSEIESLQNRTCRCLANMLLSPGSWELAHKTSMSETISKGLNNTELKMDTIKTFIRAIRLLGQCGHHVTRLVEVNAVGAVLKHIDSTTQEVKQSALRCLHSLSVNGCSIRFATQVVSSGKIGFLLDLVKEHNEEVFSLVVRLHNNHNFRAEFGNAGGIVAFRDLFLSADSQLDNWRNDLLNVLCLCCKEVVNRVKLREEQVLTVLLESLTSEQYSALHQRIVSALVCFLYDEPSMDVLLDHGLVQVLTRLLTAYINGTSLLQTASCEENVICKLPQRTDKERSAVKEKDEIVAEDDSEAGILHIETNVVCIDQSATVVAEDTNISSRQTKNSVEGMESSKVIIPDRSVLSVETIVTEDTNISSRQIENSAAITDGSVLSVENIDLNSQNISQISTEDYTMSVDTLVAADDHIARDSQSSKTTATSVHTDHTLERYSDTLLQGNCSFDRLGDTNEKQETEGESDVEAATALPPVYSIDSPTYTASTDVDFESYWKGAKCIESFSPSHPGTIARQSSYSPFSNVSYYSPQKSPSEYSPGSSPNWSQTPPPNPDANLNAWPGPSHSSYHESPRSPSENSQNVRYWYTGVNIRIYNTACSPAASPERAVSTQSGTSPRRSWSTSSDGSPHIHSDDELKIVSNTDTSLDSSLQQDSVNRRLYEYSPVSSPHADSHEEGHIKGHEERLTKGHEEGHDEAQKEGHTRGHGEGHDGSQKQVTTEDNKSTFSQGEDVKSEKEADEVKLIVDTENSSMEHLTLGSSIYSGAERKRKKTRGTSTVYENNILILLSRVSQMNDPTMHLVTKEVLTCLLNYISEMEAPLARCARLLTRVFRNPACFHRLISQQVPTLIFHMLLQGDVAMVSRVRSQMNSSKSCDRKKEVSSDSDRYSMTEEEERHPHKRRRLSGDTDRLTQKFKGVFHMQEEEVCEAGKCGIAFLEDLSCVADSQFGQGTMDRVFHTTPENQHLDICISLLFIVWSSGSRQFYFRQRDILDHVLSQLQVTSTLNSCHVNIIIRALSFLAKMTETKRRYQSNKSPTKQRSLTKVQFGNTNSHRDQSINHEHSVCLASSRENQNQSASSNDVNKHPGSDAVCLAVCEWESSLPLDIVFVTKDGQIPANKSTLTRQSEVFSAMLTGHYSEARRSQINIPETSTSAFRYIIHFLHGCKRKHCHVLSSLYSDPVTVAMVTMCIEVIFESDKLFLTSLKDQMLDCLYNRLIVPESCLLVLRYIAVCHTEKLQRAAVSSLLVDCADTGQLVRLIIEVLKSDYANVFLNTLVDIFVDV